MNNFTENIVLDGALVSKLRAEIEDVFAVDRVEIPRQVASGLTWPLWRKRRASSETPERPSGVIFFVGQLLRANSEEVYDLVAQRWRALDYTPLLRRHKGQIALIAQPGVVNPKPANPWINVGLAIATIISVLFVGASYELQNSPTTLAEWFKGLPMMLTIMTILLAHEFGHYLTARHYKIAATLPYFIPLPVPVFPIIGTLGAFIQMRAPTKTKKQMFDIGIAGPLAGLVIAIPLIFVGVAGSSVTLLHREETSALEGNSIVYLTVKYLVHGQLLPHFDNYANLPGWQQFFLLWAGVIPQGGGRDIMMSTVAFAAWFGLLITMMNLVPVGQLDGGHVIHCLLGDKALWLGRAMLVIMALVGLFFWPSWLVWMLLILFIVGTGHPPPLNDLIELGPGRKVLAYLMIFLFFILFVPYPFQPM
jgi:membrane-associated protease RseP (regulator of RpoE activity)